jgi:hypothetical protein
MKSLNRRLVIAGLAGVMTLALGSVAGTALAVPPHRHCMLTPQGHVELAPGVVENAPHNIAFHEFHSHVHVGNPPTTIIPIFDLNQQCPE